MPDRDARLEWKDEDGFRGYGCSKCGWVLPNPSPLSGTLAVPTFVEMQSPPEFVKEKFQQHDCTEHPMPKTEESGKA